MDGSEIPEAVSEADGRGAVQLVADTLGESPEPVTLIPLGPLTNIAAFLREHPDLKARIAHTSLVGGSIGPGNTTPAAEFNIYVDPEAAREVFGSGLPVTMSGLDVTHQADPAVRDRLRSMRSTGEVVAGFLEFFAASYKAIHGFGAPPLHDPVAVAAVLEPALLETRTMNVEVEFTRGETVCDLDNVTGKTPNADVGVELDREGFFDLLHDSLRRLWARAAGGAPTLPGHRLLFQPRLPQRADDEGVELHEGRDVAGG